MSNYPLNGKLKVFPAPHSGRIVHYQFEIVVVVVVMFLCNYV